MNSAIGAKHARKEAAVTFLRLAASGMVKEAYDRYVGVNFRHHNPDFPGDAPSLAAGMAEGNAKNPVKEFDVRHVVEEGDLVVVHSRVRQSSDTTDIAVAHIFRFEGDQIVELWDIGQQEPENSPNQNGMF